MRGISSPGTFLATAAVACCLLSASARAQSGRAGLTGYVAFDGVAYVDKQPTATVELFKVSDKERAHPVAAAKTGEHGQYEIQAVALGEMIVRISAADFAAYETTLYFPSDFQGRIATLLKRPVATTEKK